MRPNRFVMVTPILVWTLALGGCARRGGGEINVDEVQGYVNAVEKHLRAMRSALRAKNLDQAVDEFEEAREILSERRTALAAYPEAAELSASVAEAEHDLCYGAVNVALNRFFEAVRAKDLIEAQERLKRARKEHDRCLGMIAERQDYPPLKMNLDSAPESLVELQRELDRPALLAKIAAAKKELEPLRTAIREQLAALEKNPAQRDLAVSLHAAIKDLDARIKAVSDFGGEKEWLIHAATLQGEVAEALQKREGLVRRGKILVAANSLLPVAERNLVLAAKEKDKAKARSWLQQSAETYSQVERLLADVEAEERGLSSYLVPYKGKKRKMAWLKIHVAQKKKEVAARIARLEGKKPAPTKKPKPKPKKRTRGRRIQRW